MKLLILFFLAASSASAMPKKFEIWFLSPDTARNALLKLPGESAPEFGLLSAQVNLQCQQMGDYCFDPQVGMYKPGDEPLKNVEADYAQADKLEDYDYETKALGKEREKAKCDENSYFSLFCRKKTVQNKTSPKFTLWFDISSSMKQVDFSGYDKMCKRESFLRLLAQDCGFNQGMQVYGFNESKKQLGTMDSVCLNHGNNNRDRIIRDIKNSDAKHLVVITDIYEADETLLNFVETSGVGSVKGVEKPMYASDLKEQAQPLRKKCL